VTRLDWRRVSHTVTATESAAGVAYLTLVLAQGVHLKIVNAWNRTRPWDRIDVHLRKRDTAASSADTISLLHRSVQMGSRNVQWKGDIEIEGQHDTLTVAIWDISTSDIISFAAGIET